MESLQELDVLQAALNEAIDAIREELSTHNLPPLSTSGHTHPLDDSHYTPSPRIFEARKLALGERINVCVCREVSHALPDILQARSYVLYLKAQI
jgi:hypothetical protein